MVYEQGCSSISTVTDWKTMCATGQPTLNYAKPDSFRRILCGKTVLKSIGRYEYMHWSFPGKDIQGITAN